MSRFDLHYYILLCLFAIPVYEVRFVRDTLTSRFSVFADRLSFFVLRVDCHYAVQQVDEIRVTPEPNLTPFVLSPREMWTLHRKPPLKGKHSTDSHTSPSARYTESLPRDLGQYTLCKFLDVLQSDFHSFESQIHTSETPIRRLWTYVNRLPYSNRLPGTKALSGSSV